MERINQLLLAIIIIGLVLIAPLGLYYFLSWFLQQPLLISLATIGAILLISGLWIAFAINVILT